MPGTCTELQLEEVLYSLRDIERGLAEERQLSKKAECEDSSHGYITLFCTQCGYMHVVQLNCGDRTCPVCRKKWYGYHFRALANVMAAWKNVRIMTLTLKNIQSECFSKESVKNMRKSFTRLLHRKYFKSRIKGGFYFVHITNHGRGFHLHIHAVYEGEYIDNRKLSQAWHEITLDSFIVDVMKKNVSVKRALKYLLGDLLQKPKILDQYKCQYNEVMKGTRLVQGFGSYAHEKLREPFRCPICNNTEWYCPHYDSDLYQGIIYDDTS